jgi:predicted CopG family antitoxin
MYTYMATITITITDDAYKALKAEKREGESFSDVILRKFQRGNPAAIKAVLLELGPDSELADAIETASRKLRKNFKTRKVEL